MPKIMQHLSSLPESDPCTQDPTRHSSQVSTASTVQPESWEADLISFLELCKTGDLSGLDTTRAQDFADWLDMVRRSADHLN
jgi:hypothetical protein